jgi:hypothetical protein
LVIERYRDLSPTIEKRNAKAVTGKGCVAAPIRAQLLPLKQESEYQSRDIQVF